jgi:transglutaminase-like putative cysteine protease
VKAIGPDLSARPQGRHGTENLLDEVQLLFGQRQQARYVHWADRVTAPEGIDGLSPLRFEYDPGYQQLQLHYVRARRGKDTIDVLRTASVKTFDMENELDRRLFDGRRSLVIVPKDLRVGDVLEVALTVVGSNPVFANRAIGAVGLGGGSPVHRVYRRILVQRGKGPVAVRLHGPAPQPTRDQHAGAFEYVWDLADPPLVEHEDGAPDWFEPYPLAVVSDFADWEAVRAWALPLYPPRPTTPAMASRVAEWQRGHSSAEERALAALRFLQDDVRYLGFELGPNSHAPHLPGQVFAQRFGDCKDKAYLLATLLRAMGIDAHPALVDSDSGDVLDRQLPSPFAFDHVIVRARIAGRVYWLDPTRSQQGGSLQTQATPSYGFALVLAPGSTGLDAIPEDRIDRPLVSMAERYEVEHDGAASLEVETTYLGSAADQARARYAHARPDDLSRRFVNFYSKRHPTITVVRSPQVGDDRLQNKLVLRETYAIPRFWNDDEIWLRGYLIDDELQEPSVRLRKQPLALHHPAFVQHDVEVLLPTVFDIELLDNRIERQGVAFHRTVKQSGRLVSMQYTFRTTARDVPAAEVPAYFATLEEIRKTLEYNLWVRGGRGKKHQDREDATIGIAVLVGIFGVPLGLFLGGRRFYRRYRQRVVRRRYQASAGETAAAAIPIDVPDDATAAGERIRCACGGRMTGLAGGALETARLGDEVVHSGRFRCDRCGRERPLYFRVRPGSAAASG